MKVFITKYALTTGIFAADVEDCGNGMVREAVRFGSFFHGKEWHLTREAAIKHAEVMRLKKVHSLNKQIAKLEALKFS